MTTPLPLRVQQTVASVLGRVPSTPGPLAPPPPGSDLRAVPGDPGAPFVGRSLEFASDMLGFARQRYEQYGPVSWSGAFGRRMVAVLGPDAIGQVLVNKDKYFGNADGWGFFIGPFFRRGVMLLDFEEHRTHRRILQEAFTKARLGEYLDVMTPRISRSLDDWTTGDGVRIYERIKQMTLDIGTEVFVGDELGPRADRVNRAFVDTVHAGVAVVRAPVPGGSWKRGLDGRTVLEDYFTAQIPAKRAGEGRDMFSVLCRARSDEGETFSDDDVVNHMIFLLMAAHDTSTITLSMMSYLLAKNPEWQEKLREESFALGETGSMADLDSLVSLDLAMRETLRMYAPVGQLARITVRDADLQGFHIPAGTLMSLGIHASQRMEPWWDRPDEFDPDRFAPERAEDKSHRFAWMPFGGGVHKCIGLHFGGMEVKAIMHAMLRRFRWSVPDDYVMPIGLTTGPTPADHLPLRLERL
ncbi:cytochrome P450 [Actinomycetospora termitidis]|uniref:Cytochrome P450 n=1 Tax=Actinomycetospora termitidis TaxID=3053470 RepID=A0ABT7M191_9PSEU|nr:cytochrome P450 [Actinomycetospora sp. Odt1-22]MDL5154430.1 cytochrome P450 [Actinomycetospora sp. Odt1-22]